MSKDILFNYYAADIEKVKPLGVVSLHSFLEAIKNPKPDVRERILKIREATELKNEELKAELKMKLFSFTCAVLVNNRRAYADIKKFTGLLVLDFDKFANHSDAFFFKQIMFEKFEFIHAAWFSSSGKGVRALVKIPICTSVDEYKSYFKAIKFQTNLGKVKHFDMAPQNAVLPLFISFDEDILIREDSPLWDKKHNEPATVYTPPPLIDYKKDVDVKAIVSAALEKISDAGHPILRATAYAVGGYVGAGHLTKMEAISIMDWAIENHNYLNKKQSVYKQTARTMIEKGLNQPISK
jgi:hypothetical protein